MLSVTSLSWAPVMIVLEHFSIFHVSFMLHSVHPFPLLSFTDLSSGLLILSSATSSLLLNYSFLISASTFCNYRVAIRSLRVCSDGSVSVWRCQHCLIPCFVVCQSSSSRTVLQSAESSWLFLFIPLCIIFKVSVLS